ncbi:uncharacterized protein G2W53_041298 [Senna tora]|uniref:MULE transposase domain-containing protein n=1 Tax=Senna tora TaxID=362788 RepID=A0A834SJR4_9FABA|nr:uncharacterized protein G2W53_041298 [Senna tora]
MEFFTIEVHYGGKLVGEPTFAYEGGHTGWLENYDIDRWSYWEVVDCLKELGTVRFGRLWFKLLGHSLENGLDPIEDDKDAMAMVDIATKSRKIDATSFDEDDVQYESDDSSLNIRFNDNEEEDGLFNHGLFDVEVTKSQAVDVPDVATADEVGTLFLTQEDFKDVVATYAVHAGRDLYFDKSDWKGVRVKCAVEDCDRTHNVKFMSSKWLSKRLGKKVRDNPKMIVKDIMDKTQEKWTVNCSMSNAPRARKGTHEEINGSFTEQFRRLYDYCEEIKRSNPGSNVKLKVKRLPTAEDGTLGPPQFERLYICLDACKKSSILCRPIVDLDGCFLKTPCGGQLLAAIGRDPNDKMLPIAIAVVEVETKDSWSWFLSFLIRDIGVASSKSYTFISDQQKAAKATYPAQRMGEGNAGDIEG